MSTSRRLARWVAWNVDGTAMRRLQRSDDFRLDPRLPADVQVGEELYADNRLDRGHLARRADLTWGTRDRGRAGQHRLVLLHQHHAADGRFNQASRWACGAGSRTRSTRRSTIDRLRISVFGGPVLRDDDLVYRGVPVPREFWKVIAWEEDGALTARAFLLTQDLDPLEIIDLGEFETYQLPVASITERTGVVSRPRAVVSEPCRRRGGRARTLVTSEDDIVW